MDFAEWQVRYKRASRKENEVNECLRAWALDANQARARAPIRTESRASRSAAIARRDRARATEERNAVLEEINKAADCHVESCDVELLAGLLDEARSLGVDASTIV